MPTYEYRCDSCEHELEEFQSITAKPLKKCPKCGKNSLKRLISVGAGVVFKGSGFWQTDYARGADYKKSAEADGKSASAKSDAKSDSKADAPAPAASTPAPCGSSCGCHPKPAKKKKAAE
jgi:putative FmdB family regulatory protein